MNHDWFLVYVAAGQEDKAKHRLEQRIQTMEVADQIFAVVVPVVNEFEVRGGKKKTVPRKAFPGYIMVQMSNTEETWDVVKGTPGIIGFIGPRGRPTPMPGSEARAILDRMKDTPMEIRVSYKKGDSVRVATGPLKDLVGKVDEIYPGKGRVKVLLTLFGRETSSELDILAVEEL